MHNRWLTDIIHLLIFDVHDFPETILFTDTVLFFACYGIVDFPNTVLLNFKIKYCFFFVLFCWFQFCFWDTLCSFFCIIHWFLQYCSFSRHGIVHFQTPCCSFLRYSIVSFSDTILLINILDIPDLLLLLILLILTIYQYY